MASSEDVKVRVRQGDKEETMVLNLKISFSSLRGVGGGGSKVFIELTSETDLLLYYSVSITESDFHVLKNEQRLLVDLHQFPEMIRQLVKLPNAIVSLLTAVDESAALTITETSQFREISHLYLKLRKGTDEAVKTYLAARLGHFKSIATELETRVEDLTRENKKLCGDRDMCVTELSKLRVETDTAVSAIQATCRAQLAELREDHAREIRDLHMSTSSEYSSESRRLLDELREKDARNRELERRLDDTRMMLLSAENTVKTREDRVGNLEQQLSRKESEIREQGLKIKHYEERISTLSSEIVSLRNDWTRATSEVVPEVHAKEETIAKLQMKNKELKRALKETQNALLGQEKVVQKLTNEIDEARARLTESSGLAEEVKRLEAKLSESKNVIDSNARAMTYLNQQQFGNRTTGYLGLPSPITTPSLLVDPPQVSDYPNRSVETSSLSIPRFARESPTISEATHRVFKGPVKFTARIDSKEPLIK